MLDPERHWEPTCRALGLDDAARRSRTTRRDERAPARVAELHPIFVDAIASLPLADLKARLAAQTRSASTIASPVEVIDDPQVVANGYLAARTRITRRRGSSSSPMQFDGAGPRDPPARTRGRRAHRRSAARGRRRRRARSPAARGGCRGVRSPVPQPAVIWGVGLNYRDHAAETGRPLPDGADVVREVAELGHRAGRPDRHPAARHPARLRRRARGRDRASVPRRRASPTRSTSSRASRSAHDVSARDHQYTTGQWSWSKSFDTFCPLGPEVVSLDEIDLAGGLAIETRVNGEVAAVVEHVRARVLESRT